jgi:hypothetical protein
MTSCRILPKNHWKYAEFMDTNLFMSFKEHCCQWLEFHETVDRPVPVKEDVLCPIPQKKNPDKMFSPWRWVRDGCVLHIMLSFLRRKECLYIEWNAKSERLYGSQIRQIQDFNERTWPFDDEGNQETSEHPDLHSNAQDTAYYRRNHIFVPEWKQFPPSDVISPNRRQYWRKPCKHSSWTFVIVFSKTIYFWLSLDPL